MLISKEQARDLKIKTISSQNFGFNYLVFGRFHFFAWSNLNKTIPDKSKYWISGISV
jgi:hypothetical protein